MRLGRTEAGFTLIELGVVVALVAIMAMIAFPHIGGLLGGRKLTAFTRQLAGALDYTRAQAVIEGRPYSFYLDRNSRKYWVTRMVPGGEEEPVGGRLGRKQDLPDGVRITGQLSSPLHFYPGGNSDQATIELRRQGDYGRRYIIEVKPHVGRCRITFKG